MRKVAISLLIITVCAASLVLLNRAGYADRRAGKSYVLARERFPVYLVQKTGDVCTLWDEKGVHGRMAVHLGKFLHFLKPEDKASPGGARPPMQLIQGTRLADILADDPAHFNGERADYKSYLWVAFQTNRIRGIYNVIPPADFLKRFQLTDAKAAQIDIDKHEFGSPRLATTRLPALAEPVLLNIDASYFASTDPAQLLATLLKSGLRSDVISLCLAEDNPDVGAPERQRLRDFIGLLSGHADIIPFVPAKNSSAGAR
jgi:hypothetical protein